MASTPLAGLLAERIRARGPISVAEYMAEALGHPEHGYYIRRDPFGRRGDFTTAPEVSQMFGELVGLWAAVVWQMMGAPGRVVLAEMGPGRGTLMSDLLRAAATVAPFRAAAEIHLVETSPHLRRRQEKTLAGHAVTWHDRFDQLPDGPMILVANELFDALPIRQFEKRAGIWRERLVGLGDTGEFEFIPGPEAAPPLDQSMLDDAQDGSVAEWGEAGRALAAAMGARLARQGGAALIVDYGYDRSGIGDTLQAVRKHRFHPVLHDPGDADLTAHVDFAGLAESAAPSRAWGPVSQARFLTRLGIEARAAMLQRAAQPTVAADIAGQLQRLIDPAEMGTLFRVLALADPALPAPPGLEQGNPPA
ncbi:MAG: class I SAM-dependent methyltransferase [Actinomycetota bacterium]